jgi:hypothetical protein
MKVMKLLFKNKVNSSYEYLSCLSVIIDLPPISSPEVHHHEQISNELSPPSPVARLLLQEHLRQHTLRCPPH